MRAVFADDEYAMVLDDLNGDYREVELCMCRLVDGEWDDLFTLDDQGIPDEGTTCANGWVMGFDGHFYNWIYGREQPGASVALAFGDATMTVVADARGFWLRVKQDDDTNTALRRVD